MIIRTLKVACLKSFTTSSVRRETDFGCSFTLSFAANVAFSPRTIFFGMSSLSTTIVDLSPLTPQFLPEIKNFDNLNISYYLLRSTVQMWFENFENLNVFYSYVHSSRILKILCLWSLKWILVFMLLIIKSEILRLISYFSLVHKCFNGNQDSFL